MAEFTYAQYKRLRQRTFHGLKIALSYRHDGEKGYKTMKYEYMNMETGEILTCSEMIEQGRALYDLDDDLNTLNYNEYYLPIPTVEPRDDKNTIKEKTREFAQLWQEYYAPRAMSYSEVAYWGNFFTDAGRLTGLTAEFRENGII